jgi:hypothetical protein
VAPESDSGLWGEPERASQSLHRIAPSATHLYREDGAASRGDPVRVDNLWNSSIDRPQYRGARARRSHRSMARLYTDVHPRNADASGRVPQKSIRKYPQSASCWRAGAYVGLSLLSKIISPVGVSARCAAGTQETRATPSMRTTARGDSRGDVRGKA